MTSNERARNLIMAVLDDEHTPQDLAELEALAAASPEIREEWARFARVKEATRTMAWQDPPPETWDRYWMHVYNRTERTVAWLLILGGGLTAVVWWLWTITPALLGEWFQNESVPMAIRIAVVAAAAGVIVLVVSVVREQLIARHKDRYAKGVIR
jgi:ferric-dicitrate binding protein FerR (iron transport regulator)